MSTFPRPRILRQERDPAFRLYVEQSLPPTERLFESNVLGIFHAGPDTRILAANDAFLSAVGRSREELERGELSWIDLTAPGWEEADGRAMVELMTSGTCVPYEKEYRRGDGSRVPILTGAALQPDSQEAVGFVLDLTDRKRAEMRAALLAEAGSVLSESLDHEETLQSLVHLTVPRLADYGLIFELQEGPRLRLVALRHVDPAQEDALRRLGQGLQDSPDSCLWRVVQTGQSELVSDGGREPAGGSSLFVPLAARGDVLGVLQLATSGSRRAFGPKDLELAEGLASRASLAIDNARLYGQAEAASKAKDHFLAALSHELRTPLTPVLMKVSALAQSPDLPESLRADLRMIRRNVELEAKLIDDLLDLTRVSRGKLALHFEVTDVHSLLEHVVAICSEGVENVRLRIHLEPGAAAHHVWADSARLQQVYWNLVKNAVKFTPDGGRITVRTRNPELGRLEVSVIDPGIGIEPAELPRLFDAFEQGNAAIPRTFGGLGLGLAICKALVDQHGGELSGLSPGRGQGATFTVTLATVAPPRAAAPAEATPGPAEPPPLSLRLLLVEDNEPTLDVMTTLLELAGHDVKPAADVRTARELAGSHEFDLVVSDLGLPDGTGFELMSELRDRYGLKGIAVSGFGMEEDLRRSSECGFLEHLVKPVDVDKLKAALARVAQEIRLQG